MPPPLEQNLGDHKAIDDGEFETVVARWLITHGAANSFQEWKIPFQRQGK
jgi:hypothetical protein